MCCPSSDLPGFRCGLAKRRALRHRRPIPTSIDGTDPDPTVVEPVPQKALGQLSNLPAVLVFLIEGPGMGYLETVTFLGLDRSTVPTHHDRRMKRLRSRLGVPGAV